MLFLNPTLAVVLLAPLSAAAEKGQIPIANTESFLYRNQSNSPRVAVIGAGIAGASTAFRLHELTRFSPALSVTIYESESSVGGRVKSVSPPEKLHMIVEVGAPQFFTNDWCMMTSMKNVGLKEMSSSPWALPRTMGVWDGKEFKTAPKCNVESWSWWNIVRLTWKYGASPWRFRSAVLSTLGKWESFASLRPFDSFVKELKDVGLDDLLLGSAEKYLWNLSIGPHFQSDFVQPCTRAQFSQNLADLRGFSSLIAAEPSKAISIEGGNSRLIDRMIKISGAHLRLNTKVQKISPGHHRRYRLSAISDSLAHSPILDHTEFDIVVLAVPLQSSKIDLSDLGLHPLVSLSPYIETHVTHFTTPVSISPKFFDPHLNTSVPDDVLTIHTNSHDLDLFSLSKSEICYRRGCLPEDDCDQCEWENLYRVLSHYQLEDNDILRMIGQQVIEGAELIDYDVSWVHRQAWPHAFPRYQENHALLKDIEIAPKLFYLNSAEEVISSMEMSCRMGHNAAEKLYWRVLGPLW